MAELMFYRGDREFLRCPLAQTLKLGRHPDNDFTLPDENISRFHCIIESKENGFWLTDHQSRNGTYINGQRVKTAALKEGDEIQIGSWRIRFAGPDRWADQETKIDKGSEKIETFCGMIGGAAAMREVFVLLERLAPLLTPVLIIGETGTGKELAARALHDLSPRARRPFVAVNCGGISPNLIESEIFGHERGAFTGAAERHAGAFEQASGGSLFLDEVGELPLDLQPKLLRVLEDQKFRRVGGREEIRTAARLIVATHRDLQKSVAQGKFREDLFFRLFTVPVKLPPLRERKEDIPPLCDFFLRTFQPQETKKFSDAARLKLADHIWKGNVRELKNTVMRALFFTKEVVIGEGDIQFPDGGEEDADRSLEGREREAIVRALREHGWNKAKTAAALGIAKSTLFQKIKDYGIKED